MRINYAEIAYRILGKLKAIDVELEALHSFWEQFEHLKLKDGYKLDVYYMGSHLGGHYELYGRKCDRGNFWDKMTDKMTVCCLNISEEDEI